MTEILGFNDRQEIIPDYTYSEGLLKIAKKTYEAGWLVSPTIEEILLDVKRKKLKKGIPKIEIVQDQDVAEAILNAKEGEIFQGASQFNALEMISPSHNREDGIYIYQKDKTQGAISALMTVPSLFVRNYVLPEFNALSELKIELQNGYLIWGENSKEYLNLLKDWKKIKILGMVYAQVTGVKNGQVHSQNKYIHQIFSSSIPYNCYGNKDGKKIIRKVLEAEYLGALGLALLMAYYDKLHPVIHFTLVGNGVFQNDLNDVITAMKKAISKFKKYDFTLFIHAYTTKEYDIVRNAFLV